MQANGKEEKKKDKGTVRQTVRMTKIEKKKEKPLRMAETEQ